MSTETVSQEKTLYALDPSHSTVEFSVRHLMISKVRGRFAAFQGSIELAPGSDIPQTISVSIDAKSIDTREEQRDNHLRSADFFDVEQYPNLTFESTRIEGTSGDLRITGNLTMHGVTKEVTLEAEFEGHASDPWGGQRVGYSAKTTVNRKDFGLSWNQALERGGVMVSDEVRIELNVQAVLQK